MQIYLHLQSKGKVKPSCLPASLLFPPLPGGGGAGEGDKLLSQQIFQGEGGKVFSTNFIEVVY